MVSGMNFSKTEFCVWPTKDTDIGGSYLLEAGLEPGPDGLLGYLLFYDVFKLFPGQQLLQLQSFPYIHRSVAQHAVTNCNYSLLINSLKQK